MLPRRRLLTVLLSLAGTVVAVVVAARLGVPGLSRISLVGGREPLRAQAISPAAIGGRVSFALRATPDDAPGRVEERTFRSRALRREMPYLVYLPPGYDSRAEQRYPVLYMLHGLGSTYRQWQELGLLDTAEQMMRSGRIAPVIIVLAEGERSYWVNHANGGPAWGTYIARDLVRAIDDSYRTIPARERRAIGGDSMGGHGALQLAINNPSVFGVVGAHSVALRRRETAPAYFGGRAAFNRRDPFYLYGARAALAKSFKLWIDIGMEDRFYPRASDFHQMLERQGIAHQWHVWPGGHTDSYWSDHLAAYLRFYSAALSDPLPAEVDDVSVPLAFGP